MNSTVFNKIFLYIKMLLSTKQSKTGGQQMEKEIKKTQETTKVVEGTREDGKKVVNIRRGMKETTRLDHTVPSWMTSEE